MMPTIARNAGGFGAPWRHFRVTDSTNARVRELVDAGAPGGTVVTAEEQTAGRGRQGRSWTAPPGKALLYSAILRPFDGRHRLLPLVVPLAVCEAAEELSPGVECQVKWPNDIWIEERKLAGVLIEAKPQDGWAVIGIGLNLSTTPEEFPPDLREKATSLFSSTTEGRRKSRRSLPAVAPAGLPPPPPAVAPTGRPPTLRQATAVLGRCLDHWVTAEREETLAAWRSRDALRGRQVSWDGGSGVADGIDDSGRLAVLAAGGDRVLLGAGDVHLRL